MNKRRADNGIPKYQQIATDIAYKIVNGIYQEDQKIYARSAIGSQYSVSSETARRAMCILADWDVVTIEKNSGVLIKSVDNAKNFLQQQKQTKSIQNLKRNILDCRGSGFLAGNLCDRDRNQEKWSAYDVSGAKSGV